MAPSLPFKTEALASNVATKSRVRWLFAMLCCLYYLVTYSILERAVPIFGKMFDGIGVAIPLPTRLLLATCWWFLPLVPASAIALTIAKQLVSLDKLPLRVTNLILIISGVVLPVIVIFCLYLPLLVLIWKLHAAH